MARSWYVRQVSPLTSIQLASKTSPSALLAVKLQSFTSRFASLEQRLPHVSVTFTLRSARLEMLPPPAILDKKIRNIFLEMTHTTRARWASSTVQYWRHDTAPPPFKKPSPSTFSIAKHCTVGTRLKVLAAASVNRIRRHWRWPLTGMSPFLPSSLPPSAGWVPDIRQPCPRDPIHG